MRSATPLSPDCRGPGGSATPGAGERARPQGMPGNWRGEALGAARGSRACRGHARRAGPGGALTALGYGGRRGTPVCAVGRAGKGRAASSPGAEGREGPLGAGVRGTPCLGRPRGWGRAWGCCRRRRRPVGLCRPLRGLVGSGGSSGKFWDLWAGKRLVAGQWLEWG